jgi:hypothetical protein
LLCFSITIIYFANFIIFVRASVCLTSLALSVYEENLGSIITVVTYTYPQCFIRMGVILTNLTGSINMQDFIIVITVIRYTSSIV